MPISLKQPESSRSTDSTLDLRAITIVVPCYNEEAGIRQLHNKLTALAERLSPERQLNLLFVDDGSVDNTVQEIREVFGEDRPGMRLIQHTANLGIAAAISTGIAAAETELVCSIDSDCTYEPDHVLDLLERLSDEVDVVVASPYHPQGSIEHIPAWRLALSRTASRMYCRLFRNKLHTYTACFRLYRRSVANQFRPTQPGFVGVVELIWMLDNAGFVIAECPTHLTSRAYGQSKMRVISVALAHFRLMVRIATRMQPTGRVAEVSTAPVLPEQV